MYYVFVRECVLLAVISPAFVAAELGIFCLEAYVNMCQLFDSLSSPASLHMCSPVGGLAQMVERSLSM